MIPSQWNPSQRESPTHASEDTTSQQSEVVNKRVQKKTAYMKAAEDKYEARQHAAETRAAQLAAEQAGSIAEEPALTTPPRGAPAESGAAIPRAVRALAQIFSYM